MPAFCARPAQPPGVRAGLHPRTTALTGARFVAAGAYRSRCCDTASVRQSRRNTGTHDCRAASSHPQSRPELPASVRPLRRASSTHASALERFWARPARVYSVNGQSRGRMGGRNRGHRFTFPTLLAARVPPSPTRRNRRSVHNVVCECLLIQRHTPPLRPAGSPKAVWFLGTTESNAFKVGMCPRFVRASLCPASRPQSKFRRFHPNKQRCLRLGRPAVVLWSGRPR